MSDYVAESSVICVFVEFLMMVSFTSHELSELKLETHSHY